MMRILYLSQVLPYPTDAGPKMRSYYLLRYLSQRYKIVLVCFVRQDDTEAYIDHLRQYCEQVIGVPIFRSLWRDGFAFLKSIFSRIPFLITRDESRAMNRALEEFLQKESFDFIHADQLWMAPYALYAYSLVKNKGENPKTVLDQHNAVHLIPLRMAAEAHNPVIRWLLEREARLMSRYEVETCQEFDRVIWVTNEDYRAVKEKAKQLDSRGFDTVSPHTVIPICIDCDEIQPVQALSKKPVIFFLGGMHWPPNAEGVIWFAREILPLIKNKLPEVEFLVVGKQPPKEILNREGIHTPGFVFDVEPHWQMARVFVVPLRAGGGMRVKILDAWAHGVPVVSTTIGAEGLDYFDGDNILVADTADDLANAMVQGLTKSGYGEQLARNGAAWVAQHYDWKKIYHAWDAIYPSTLN